MNKFFSCLCVSMCFSMPLMAQMDTPIIATPPYNPGLDLLGSSIQAQVDDDEDFGVRDASPQPTSAAVTYIASKSRTRQNLLNFADKTRVTDPAQADKMEAFFASTDVIGQIGAAMVQLGLNKNNTADAFAVYWITAWQASAGDLSDYSPATYRAVAAQAARGLSQSSEFAAANDAQKQEMAEALMVQAALIGAVAEEAASDAVQLKAIGKAVKQGASASGLELDTMTLTEEGFREGGPRKRSDASDTAGNEKALAANDTGTDDDGTTNYALIAAAAGAGLGGVFLLGKAMGRKG